MEHIDIELPQGRVQGALDSRFAPLLDAFVDNFKSRGELGASLALSLEGRPCVDLWGGHKDLARVAPMVPYKPGPDAPITEFTKALLTDPQSISALSLLNSGGHEANAPAALAAELGGGGGVSNARSVAGLFAPLAAPGGSLFTADEVARMGAVSAATQEDATLLIPTRFALGFMKSMDNRARPFGAIESCVLSETAFGHVGAGGSLGFADPACGLAFGYTMNAMGAGLLLNDRGQSLVDATYACLGHRSSASGRWLPSA